MTSTSGATLERRLRGKGAPFVIAFGCALVTSSAVGAALPTYPWTTTSLRQEVLTQDLVALPDQTSSGLPKVNGAPANGAAASLAQRIAEIRALVGLTTDQVGRLFGVSRRSVYNWINGNAMAPQHEERAAKILSIVRTLPGSTPVERRSALLDSSRGTSLFHQLIATRVEAEPLQVAGATAKERIGL